MADELELFFQEVAEAEKAVVQEELATDAPPVTIPAATSAEAKPVQPPVGSKIILKDNMIKFAGDEEQQDSHTDVVKPPPAKRPAFGFGAVPRSVVAAKIIAKPAVIAKPAMITAPVTATADASVEPYPGAFGQSQTATIAPSIAPPLLPTPVSSTAVATSTATSAGTAKFIPPVAGQKRSLVRTCAGEVWEDHTLSEWPENDYRLFVGDLGNEVTDEMLTSPFRRFASFVKGKVVRDNKTHKSKGYGFVSFLEPMDALTALKEMHGAYIGNRPIKVRKSTWNEKSFSEVKKKDKEMNKKFGF